MEFTNHKSHFPGRIHGFSTHFCMFTLGYFEYFVVWWVVLRCFKPFSIQHVHWWARRVFRTAFHAATTKVGLETRKMTLNVRVYQVCRDAVHINVQTCLHIYIIYIYIYTIWNMDNIVVVNHVANPMIASQLGDGLYIQSISGDFWRWFLFQSSSSAANRWQWLQLGVLHSIGRG